MHASACLTHPPPPPSASKNGKVTFSLLNTQTHTHTHTERKRGRERTGLEMVSVFQSCPILCDHTAIGQQAPLSMQFSRQEEKSGLPFPTLGDLPDPGIECMPSASPAFPALAGRFFPLSHLGNPIYTLYIYMCVCIYIYIYIYI